MEDIDIRGNTAEREAASIEFAQALPAVRDHVRAAACRLTLNSRHVTELLLSPVMFSRTPRFAWRFREITGEIFFLTEWIAGKMTSRRVHSVALGISEPVVRAGQGGEEAGDAGGVERRPDAAHRTGRKSPVPRT